MTERYELREGERIVGMALYHGCVIVATTLRMFEMRSEEDEFVITPILFNKEEKKFEPIDLHGES